MSQFNLTRHRMFASFLLNLLNRSIWKRAHWKCLESGGNTWRMIEWTYRLSGSPIRFFFFFSQFLWMEGWFGTAAFNSTQVMPKLAGSKVKTSCLTWKPSVLLFVLFVLYSGQNVSQVASARGFLLAPHETRAHTTCLGLWLSRHSAWLGWSKSALSIWEKPSSGGCLFCVIQVWPNILSTFPTSFCSSQHLFPSCVTTKKSRVPIDKSFGVQSQSETENPTK